MARTTVSRSSWLGVVLMILLIAAGCSKAEAPQTSTSPTGASTAPATTTPTASATESPSASDASTQASPDSASSTGCPSAPSRKPRPIRTTSADVSASKDGTIALIGPTLIGLGIDQQVLIADVTNAGDTDAIWRIELDLQTVDADAIVIKVPAEKTVRLEIPIEVIASGTAQARATLTNADGVISESTLDINAVDLRDCAN